MKITNALCLGSAIAGHLHQPDTDGVQRVSYKSRVFDQDYYRHHPEHFGHGPHHPHHPPHHPGPHYPRHGPHHYGHDDIRPPHHMKHFHGEDSIDVKVVPTSAEDDKIVVNDGVTTDSENYLDSNTEEILLTDLVTVPAELNTLLAEEDRTIAVELDATEDVNDLPAKIAAALHAQAGDLINEKEVRDAIEKVQLQLENVTELLRTKAAAAATKAQELNAKAQVAAAQAVEKTKSAVGTGAETLKQKAVEAKSAAADAAQKAQAAASAAIEKAKTAGETNGTEESAVDQIKSKLAHGAEKSKKAAESVVEGVKSHAKSAAKSAADALNDFAEPKEESANKRRLGEQAPSGTVIAAGSVGVGVLAVASLAYVAARRRAIAPPSTSTSVEAQQIDALRDITEGTFDRY